MTKWTAEDVRRHQAKRAIAHAPKSKYGNKKVEVDGLLFDSKKEARRYRELRALESMGQIIELRLQTPFRICVNDRDICRYFADFTYKERIDRPLEGAPYHFSFVIEDVKSPSTRLKEVYRLKKKLVEAQYNVVIREV